MTKIRLKVAKPAELKDVTSAAAVEKIWADAAKATRAEAPAVRKRRKRTLAVR